MDFVSYSFLVFYFVALACRYSVGRYGCNQKYLLCLALLSTVFYCWHIPRYLLILSGIVLLHYIAAIFIDRHRESKIITLGILATAIVVNFLLLGIFKYADFFLSNLLIPIGIWESESGYSSTDLGIVLPIAISFYTFQTVSYTIDVYKKKIEPETDFLSFFVYISFFPQLIAGPIVRAGEFLYQFGRTRKPNAQVVFWGAYLITRGLFLKLVIADNLDYIVDRLWNRLDQPGVPNFVSFSVPFFYSVQLLCDFMAYTDIARGVAYQMGFRLPINFNAPYISTTFAEFWTRWHITLSRWFRDYLYIPLGGSHKGSGRTMFNLTLVFLISGLWHGSNITFLVWGGILGLALSAERILLVTYHHLCRTFKGFYASAFKGGAVLFWFLLVQGIWIVSLIFFRSDDLTQAIKICSVMFNSELAAEVTGREGYYFVVTGWYLCAPVLLMHLRVFIVEKMNGPVVSSLERYIYAGVMVGLSVLFYATPQSFIYFQF